MATETNVVGLRDSLARHGVERVDHAGLLHDVFPPVLRPKQLQGNNGDKFLKAAKEHLRKVYKAPVPEGYARAYEARVQMLHAHRGDAQGAITVLFEASVKGRMIVGLGAGSVLEHQVRLQHTWGVPEVPGSGLKGLASATATRYGSDAWKPTEGGKISDHQSLFGDTTHAGLVTFHDAWWKPEGSTLPLDLDVMTVHHRKYYGDPTEPPSDTEEPNPVSFLTTHGTYLLALTGPEAWVRAAAEWLHLGLEKEGVGAKTRAGYGRMEFDLTKPLVSPRDQALEGLKAALRVGGYKDERIEAILREASAAERLGAPRADVLRLVHDWARGNGNAIENFSERKRGNAEQELLKQFELPLAAPVLTAVATPDMWITARVRGVLDKLKRLEIEVDVKTVKVSNAKPQGVKCNDGSIDRLKVKADAGLKDWSDAEVVLDGKKLKQLRGVKP